jgi:hypothetical protein
MKGADTFVREEALEEQEGNISRSGVNDHTPVFSNPTIFTAVLIPSSAETQIPQIEGHEWKLATDCLLI